MDDGTGEQPFLSVELAKVDMAKWEKKYAGELDAASAAGRCAGRGSGRVR
jgi:hypothetical protein